MGRGQRSSPGHRPSLGSGRLLCVWTSPAPCLRRAGRPRTPDCPVRCLYPDVGACVPEPVRPDVVGRACLGAWRSWGSSGRWGVAGSLGTVCGIFQFHGGGLRPFLLVMIGD